MTYDPFLGDDSLGAWLYEHSEFDEEIKKNEKAKQGDIAPDDLDDRDLLEANYSDEIESDYEE